MTRLLAALLLMVLMQGKAMADAGIAPVSADSSQQILVMLHLPPAHFRPDTGYAGGYGDGLGHGVRRRIALDLAAEHGLTLLKDWPMPMLGVDCYVMAVPAGQSPQQLAEQLSRDPRVEWSQPMHRYRAQERNDPLYPVQPAARLWHLSALHEQATGRNVTVAVIDSGVDVDQPDLAGQFARRENFVDDRPDIAEQHGTAVAGIIAALADNGVGIVGVAPRARLLGLRACWQESGELTSCNSLTLARALQYAIAHDAQVINLSLSGPPDRLLALLLDAALAHGAIIVAAVDPAQPDGGFPASHPGIVAVSDRPAAQPHGLLLAPGSDIPATAPGARWRLVSGASYATAEVSGLFALLRELLPGRATLPAGAMMAIFTAPAAGLPAGSIDACSTLSRASGTCSCACSVARLSPTTPPR